MVSQTSTAALLLALALVASILLLGAEARYLPTRSDDSQKDHIRDVLRGIIEKADLEKSSGGYLGDGYPRGALPVDVGAYGYMPRGLGGFGSGALLPRGLGA
ncbi:uncharacterized protein LOC135366160 [Ornithodoros turicata]|uniref:uncharacterized protein LOC135366160 n=1 Tax=Ornithodoros turicata TaxID=34597 RepID=UPI00313A1E5C